jgi:3-phenylpropionate/trans-cinnamate dioxygenase ferredoxin reductase subunit
VELRTGVQLERLVSTGGSTQVLTTDGKVYDADAVVVGIGVNPADELARGTRIRRSNGIVVDEYCQTAVEGVYAAGDVTDHPNPILGQRLRLEHWQHAQQQAVAAARSMLGQREPYVAVPWFWSDQYDVNLQLAGYPPAGTTVVHRGDPESLESVSFFLRTGVVVGAIGLNRGRDIRTAVSLIRSRAAPDPAALADVGVDLRTIRAARQERAS